MVTSTRRRICPWSRLPLHQMMTPNPAIVMGGKQVRRILSGSSKDGANSATMVSIPNSVFDHGTVTVDESIRCPKFKGGKRGNEGGSQTLGPHPEFYKPRGNSTVSTDRMSPLRRLLPFSFHFTGSRVLARLWDQAGWRWTEGLRPLLTKEKKPCAENHSGYDEYNDGIKQRNPSHQMTTYGDVMALATILLCSFEPLHSTPLLVSSAFPL